MEAINFYIALHGEDMVIMTVEIDDLSEETNSEWNNHKLLRD